MNEHATSQAPVPSTIGGNHVLDKATLELLDYWRQQDAHATPEQIQTAEESLREHKRALNANRALAGEPSLYP